MSVGTPPERRGRASRASAGLLERHRALQAIDDTLAAARRGEGMALLLEGHPGMGKTRLHETALDRARGDGLRVLRATGAELERNLALGVAIQLLSRFVHELPAASRDAIMADAPERIRVLAGMPPRASEPAATGELPISQAIFNLIAASAESVPTLVAIDDLHWCDLASLEFVLYLLHRLKELPIAIILTRRHSIGDGGSELLARINSHPSIRLEHLSPLGPEAVSEIVHGELAERASASLVQVCHRATAGNPFYVHELLLALKDDPDLGGEQLVQRALSLAPDAVTRSLRVRVGRLGNEAAALARAVAILGDDVPLRQAAALAGLRPAAAARAADRLASVEVLLNREPLQYVHPLVRHAIEADVPNAERASRHLDAARLLYAEGESAERVAAHLLLGRAEGNQWVVGRLRAAAREAQIRGAAQSTIRYLERALAEPPGPQLRSEVLAELGAAEATLGLDAAVGHLAAAAAAAGDPLARARLLLEQGHAEYGQGQHERAAAAYTAGLAELEAVPEEAAESRRSELHDSLQIGYVVTAGLTPSLRAGAVRPWAELLERAEQRPRSRRQRILFAQAALHSVLVGEPAGRAAELAELSWDHGALIEHETSGGQIWSALTGVLTVSGHLELALEVADAALDHARRRASPLTLATASYRRGLPRLWQGRVTDAITDLEHALEATRHGWHLFGRAARAHIALCLIERGEIARAEEQLAGAGEVGRPQNLEDTFCLAARAELRLAQGRAADALEDALRTHRTVGGEIKALGYCQWRTVAALSLLALGERDRALTLAGEALDVADEIDVLHARIRARRVLGLCEGGAAGLRALEQAAALGAQGPPRLETIRALVDLGAALRRANQRAAARVPLQQAADLARGGGATALEQRARTELAAAGARPRREWLLSGPAALTPSERRIAELAAAGQSNREIAQMLFVTPKTVEYHLRNTYRKLNIGGRGELADALMG
jgi:DNA-binding CsgD family transcriptional regulator